MHPRTWFLLCLRLAVAYLFFSQLFWKLPPDFGCARENGAFAITTTSPDGHLKRGTGLCDWLGVEIAFAHRERLFLATDLDNDGTAELALRLTPLVRWNGLFVERIVVPHLWLFGWLIWSAEAVIAVSLSFGLLTRLGAILSLALAVQLTLGLAGVSDPATHLQEWEWSYLQLVLLSGMLVAQPSGRWFGIDAMLRRRMAGSRQRSVAARVLAALS